MDFVTDRLLFVFFKDQLLLKKVDERDKRIPRGDELPTDWLEGQRIHQVCLTDGKWVQALALDEAIEEDVNWRMVGLRASFEELTLEDYLAAGKASQILYWDSHSHFCPACGTPTVQHTPIMKKCPECGHELYPPIATAIIVLVCRGEELLLVRARNFRGTFHGLVAGFVEAGETLEQCVVREVKEETGLNVTNIRYFGSQPWPYPSGLMVGFLAEYESGEIKLQEDELTAAAFFTKENLPEIPSKLSMARKLIDYKLSQL